MSRESSIPRVFCQGRQVAQNVPTPQLRNIKLLTCIGLTVLFFTQCSVNCERTFSVGMFFAEEGDEFSVTINDTLVTTQRFNETFFLTATNHVKLLDGHCVHGDTIKVTISQLNTHKDTTFVVNTKSLRGVYIKSTKIGDGRFNVTKDYGHYYDSLTFEP